jgi:hypothetical protein
LVPNRLCNQINLFATAWQRTLNKHGPIRSKDAIPYAVAKAERVSPVSFHAPDKGLNNSLPSSQQSIQKVVGYALKYFSRCGEDIWDCIVEECQKVRQDL